MQFVIKHIKIENFRCFDNLETDLWKKTIVESDNEGGKSSIASAILWCLTNKDSSGSNSFEIVPIGGYGKLSPSVELECSVDDKPITLKRVYKANFARDKSFKDYATTCYINGIEVGTRKFQEKISETICNDEVFKILSNPYTFVENCPKEQKELMWQAQRRLLMNIVQQETDAETAENVEEYQPLADYLKRYDSVTQLLSYLKQETNHIEKEKNDFETKMEQQQSNIIEVDMSEKDIKSEIQKQEKLISDIESNKNKEKNDLAKAKIEATKSLKSEKESLISKYNEEMSKFNQEVIGLKMKATDILNESQRSVATQAKYATAVEKLKTQKVEEYCPTCKQHLTVQSIGEAKKNLKLRIEKGNLCVDNERKKAQQLKEKHEELIKKISGMQQPVYPARVKDIDDEIETLQSEIEQTYIVSSDGDNLNEELNKARNSIDLLKKKLYDIKQNQSCEEKMQQLEKEHEENNKKLNELQMLTDLCKDFISYKCKSAEQKINSMFKMVKFKLFEKNKSNDDIREVCNMTFNGHEYSDLSASTKLIANLDLVSAFQKHYNAYIPLVIDNLESVTADIENDAQIVQMYVKEELCPECNGKSGRRLSNGKWRCNSCGNEWFKKITIKEN